MRLLNTLTLKLEYFPSNVKDAYAILSHVWGPEKDEVSFQDMKNGSAEQKDGYQKLEKACHLAVKDGIGYIWIDTCCIDKDSSSELSEAINSMFHYYKDAAVCYAYLFDVESMEQGGGFAESKWVSSNTTWAMYSLD